MEMLETTPKQFRIQVTEFDIANKSESTTIELELYPEGTSLKKTLINRFAWACESDQKAFGYYLAQLEVHSDNPPFFLVNIYDTDYNEYAVIKWVIA